MVPRAWCEWCAARCDGSWRQKMYLLEYCVSSLRRGHANLLCIVPSLMDASKASPLVSLGLGIYVGQTALESRSGLGPGGSGRFADDGTMDARARGDERDRRSRQTASCTRRFCHGSSARTTTHRSSRRETQSSRSRVRASPGLSSSWRHAFRRQLRAPRAERHGMGGRTLRSAQAGGCHRAVLAQHHYSRGGGSARALEQVLRPSCCSRCRRRRCSPAATRLGRKVTLIGTATSPSSSRSRGARCCCRRRRTGMAAGMAASRSGSTAGRRGL